MSIPSIERQTCASHGGVDCARGADDDGSVVCADGFREAASRFAFECTSARLEVVELVRVGKTGGAVVYLRNRAQVAARQVRVALRKGGRFEFLRGPAVVEGHGMADFHLGDQSEAPPFSVNDLKIICANCAQ
jgi:hypothetical protein